MKIWERFLEQKDDETQMMFWKDKTDGGNERTTRDREESLLRSQLRRRVHSDSGRMRARSCLHSRQCGGEGCVCLMNGCMHNAHPG